MTLYRYSAIDAGGRRIRGRLHAAGGPDLEQRLHSLGLEFIHARPIRVGSHGLFKHISRRQLVTFCIQMEILMEAGIPTLDALIEVRDQTPGGPWQDVLAALVEGVQSGETLSAAMSRHQEAFSPVFVGLVLAGETAGKLPAVLRHLSENLKWEDELAAHTRRVAIYPAILLALILAAVLLAVIHVLPELARLFLSTGLALPGHTRVLLSLAEFLGKHWGTLLILTALLLLSFSLALRHLPPVVRYKDTLLLRLPILGPILRKIALCRFVSFLALLYESGIPIPEAVGMSEALIGNQLLREGLHRARNDMAEGHGVAASFERATLFPNLVLRMMRTGEQTGRLDKALRNVAYFYGRDVKESTARLQALMEPLLSVLLGGLMAWVMLSVLGPVYELLTRMKL